VQKPAVPKAEAYHKIYKVNTKKSRCLQTMKRGNLSNLGAEFYFAMPKPKKGKALNRVITHKIPL
jgi:hypothetical protein